MKKILIVIDQPGWAFHSHALQIQKRLPEYKIDIAHHRQNIAELSKNYDLVYVMDPMPMSYPPSSKTIMGVRVDWFHLYHPKGARGMYEEGFMGRSAKIKGNCCMLHAVNKKQLEAYKLVVDIRNRGRIGQVWIGDCFNTAGYRVAIGCLTRGDNQL